MTIKISELGNLTAVYGNTIVPVVANIAGTLTTVKGNLDQLTTYIISGPQTDIAVINSNVTLANTTTKGYVDGQITAANAGVTSANVGLKGYVDQANTTTKAYIDGQITAANTASSTANVGLKGYVDQANSIQTAQIASANVGIIGYIDQANTIQNAYVNGQIAAANAGVTAANVGMKGYVDNQTYSNVQVASYLPLYSGNIQSVTVTGNFVSFGNLFAANTYVPSLSNSSGSIGQITFNNDYVYVCVATNTWKRANLSVW
jgi:hypothetical protein